MRARRSGESAGSIARDAVFFADCCSLGGVRGRSKYMAGKQHGCEEDRERLFHSSLILTRPRSGEATFDSIDELSVIVCV